MTTITWWTIPQLIFFFIMMTGFGASLEFDKFRSHLKKPKGILIGFCCQYIVMPFICYSLARLSNLEDDLAVALILVGCCPGGASSNVVCYIFQMDLELSVAMTTCSSLAAIGLMPLNTYIYLKVFNSVSFVFDWIGLLISCLVVVLGTLMGLYITKYHAKYSILCERIGNVSILLLAAGNLVSNFLSNVPLWEYKPFYIYLVIFTPSILGAIIGFCCSLCLKLGKASCVAVANETGLQNAVLAIAIITLTYDDVTLRDHASGLPLVYAAFSTVLSILVTMIFFKCGWSNAQPNLTVLQAFKQYRQRRKVQVAQVRAIRVTQIPMEEFDEYGVNIDTGDVE